LNTIFLIRHGLPLFPFKKPRCIGRSDYPLSSEGKEEIERVKIFLADKEIEKIYSSPLRRCLATAEILASPEIPVEPVKDLEEISMGDWEDLSFEEIKRNDPEAYRQRGLDFSGFSPPNGESFSQCQARGKKAFLDIAAQTKGNAAIVAHAGINRVLICWLRQMKIDDLFSLPQPYGCLNIIQEFRGNYEVTDVGLLPSEIKGKR
jgi:alpha-ribazole phosphatase